MKMSKAKMLVIISIIFCLPLVASAGLAPDSFFGIKFGQSIESAIKSGIMTGENFTAGSLGAPKHKIYRPTLRYDETYTNIEKRYKIGGFRFSALVIDLIFYSNKFVSCKVDLTRASEFESLYSSLESKYGKPYQVNPIINAYDTKIGYKCLWFWENKSYIKLEFNFPKSDGKLEYADLNLSLQIMKAKEEKGKEGL